MVRNIKCMLYNISQPSRWQNRYGHSPAAMPWWCLEIPPLESFNFSPRPVTHCDLSQVPLEPLSGLAWATFQRPVTHDLELQHLESRTRKVLYNMLECYIAFRVCFKGKTGMVCSICYVTYATYHIICIYTNCDIMLYNIVI